MSGTRYFFVHMMKTAGVSLRRRLIENFGGRAVYPWPEDGTDPVLLYVSVDLLRERMAVRAHEVEVVTGHFPLCTTELLGGGFTTLTVLREPVERTLSFLRHQREYEPADRGKTLEQIYDDPVRFHCSVHNHMTKMLALSTAEMTDGMLTPIEFTPDHLERAKDALVTIDAVGFQEDFEDFCRELVVRFGWDLGEPKSLNSSEANVDISDDFRARIAEDNALDIELYEFARELAAERVIGASQ